MSTMERVRSEGERLPAGQPVANKVFMALGSRASVDQALSRLVRMGVLSRPARGVYARPKWNSYVGEVPPEPIQIANAIAAESGNAVQVHGAEAARRMGFSTQVPTKPIFYTSGPSRRFRLGRLDVLLKHVSSRKLALVGRPAGIAFTALWHLGRRQVTAETIEQVHSRLAPEEFEALCSAIPSMPGWMHDAVLRFMERRRHG